MLNVIYQSPTQAAEIMAETFNFQQADASCINACTESRKSPTSIYVFFSRYAAINGYAGPLVARLASTIGLSRGVFGDPSAPVDTSDRDMLVAARIFAATIDEFADERVSKHTHRTLAQATVEAAASYAAISPTERKKLGTVPASYIPVLQNFIQDYQGEVNNPQAIVRAIGYHIASELRADREYALIDEIFRHQNDDDHFHKWLRTHNRIIVNHEALPSWYWIAAHGHYGGSGVEWDHFDAALDAARQAHIHTALDDNTFSQLLSEGIQRFVATINQAFDAISLECQAISQQQRHGPATLIA